jgi:predicted acetyltransferase
MLYLKEANLDDAEAQWAFIRDMPENENGVENRWHGCDWQTYRETALPRSIALSGGQDLPEGYVPSTSYFLWADGEIVGLFKLRHYLNDTLRSGAGHIGYFIKKECRGRGWGTEGLRLTLERGKDVIPEEEFYLRLYKYNTPSLRVMQHNGGRIVGEDGEHWFVRIPKPAD